MNTNVLAEVIILVFTMFIVIPVTMLYAANDPTLMWTFFALGVAACACQYVCIRNLVKAG